MITHKNCRLAYGVTRIVLLTKNYAFKFPSIFEWRLFLLGLLANMQEVIFSKTKWPDLCPVLWYIPLGFLVVMPRVEVLTEEEFNTNKILLLAMLDRSIPVEIKSDSFGYLNNRIVAIDYGN